MSNAIVWHETPDICADVIQNREHVCFQNKIYISFPAVHTPKIIQQKEVMRAEEPPMIENFFAQKKPWTFCDSGERDGRTSGNVLTD